MYHLKDEIEESLINIRRSELLPKGANELKWLKSDIEQLKDELAHSRNDTSERLFLMELDFHSQVEQIDSRINTVVTQIQSVSANIFLFCNILCIFLH